MYKDDAMDVQGGATSAGQPGGVVPGISARRASRVFYSHGGCPDHHPQRGVQRALRRAAGFVVGPSTNLPNTIELVEAYRDAAVRAGREPLVALMRDAWVAETRAEAEEAYGPEVTTAYKYYWRNGLPEFRSILSEGDITLDNQGKNRLILGEPEECAAEFQRWSEAVGADYFLLRLRHAHSGGPPHEKIMDAIRLFGEEVIPACG